MSSGAKVLDMRGSAEACVVAMLIDVADCEGRDN